jgi:hypothetical protein
MREARSSPPAHRGAWVIGTDALRFVLILREPRDGQRDAGHIYPKNGGGRGPAFPGTNALRIVRAGCERHLIKEVARPR